MQKERTLKFWDDYHESNGEKEWIVLPTPDLFELIYSNCILPENGDRLRVLEIGCGTSSMAKDFWQYLQRTKDGSSFYVRSTDVSSVCVDVCFTRDKNIQNVFGPGATINGCDGLEYAILNVMEAPSDPDRGAWDAILDKACLDTFLFRSRQRGESKAYSNVIQTALDNIWTLMAEKGVYMLLSPRTKLKAVRDYAGFSSVERCAVYSEARGSVISKANKPTQKKEAGETCYIYICRKNPDYVVGVTKPFKESFRELPGDEAQCPHCGLHFGEFRNGEDLEGRGVLFWTREWKNHCIHCKAPHAPKYSHSAPKT